MKILDENEKKLDIRAAKNFSPRLSQMFTIIGG
jgi:hypothetical protein